MSEQEKPPACPNCGSTRVLPIVWGMPTRETEERARRGEVVIGGCMVWGPDGAEKDPAFECLDCEERFGEYEWRKGGPDAPRG
jgi:hypothetical protein